MSSILNDYEPLEIIGKGSFGVIRKVARRSDGQIFARKELNFERMSERDRKQIVAEVNILKDLKHENIVRYIDRYLDRPNSMLYILMEYCGGGDLSTRISKAKRSNTPIPEEEVWELFVQLVLALHHCHFPNMQPPANDPTSLPIESNGAHSKQQILHRDLKPDNVFLSTENAVKLGDFGLAKQIAAATFANTYVGTPYYMSPEIIQEKAYDAKSDIWSLGCLLFELCALVAPFNDAQTFTELANSIRSGRIPAIPKGYSSTLSSTIKSMLNVNPAMRPSTHQLLRYDRVSFTFRQMQMKKTMRDLVTRTQALEARETIVIEREAAIQREMTAAVAVTASEQQAIQAQKQELARREKAVVEREQGFVTRQNALESDRATLATLQFQLNNDRAQYEEQLNVARRDWEEFLRQKEAFEKEKGEWIRHRGVPPSPSKVPLDDVGNRRPSNEGNQTVMMEETPIKVVPRRGAASHLLAKTNSTLRPLKAKATTAPSPASEGTPRRLIPTKSLTDIGSAMKGVILTASGTAVQTPMPSRRNVRTSWHYQDTPIQPAGPSSGLPPIRSSTTSDVPIPKPPRFNLADDDDDEEEPKPPVSIAPRASLDETSPFLLPPNADPSHITSRARPVRRRSNTMLSSSRPQLSSAATTSMIPTKPQSQSSNPFLSQPKAAPHAKDPTAHTYDLGSIIRRPAAVWNLEDEENLPSPFIKRKIDFSKTFTSGSSGGSGNGSAAPLTTLTSKSRTASSKPTSAGSSTSTRSGPRSSLLNAVKASDQAMRRNGQRRVMTTKDSS